MQNYWTVSLKCLWSLKNRIGRRLSNLKQIGKHEYVEIKKTNSLIYSTYKRSEINRIYYNFQWVVPYSKRVTSNSIWIIGQLHFVAETTIYRCGMVKFLKGDHSQSKIQPNRHITTSFGYGRVYELWKKLFYTNSIYSNFISHN